MRVQSFRIALNAHEMGLLTFQAETEQTNGHVATKKIQWHKLESLSCDPFLLSTGAHWNLFSLLPSSVFPHACHLFFANLQHSVDIFRYTVLAPKHFS